MRRLLDNNLSVRLIDLLGDAGHEVQHVRDLGLAAADTDFGQLLASSGAKGPSVVLIRRSNDRGHHQLSRLLAENLPSLTEDLEAGAVVVLGETEIRVRRLPIR